MNAEDLAERISSEPRTHGEFSALLDFRPLVMDGTRRPRPEMTLLALLLEHPRLAPDTQPGACFEHRAIRRSHAELGRAIAIARLSEEDAIDGWAAAWEEGLSACFHQNWESRARRVGEGLRALLAGEEDMWEAHAACAVGLLAAMPVTMEQLRATGRRLLQDAVEPLERSAAGWDHGPSG